MFLLNKYYSYYYNIINNAKSRTFGNDVYFEKHHIIPRSIGGDNSSDNIVKLTPREHFICHLLLPKMTTGLYRYKMVHAIWQMSICDPNGKRYRPNSRIYEMLKKQRQQVLKSIKGKNHPNYGKVGPRKGMITSAETKKKLSIAKKGKYAGPNNPMYGKTHSAETRAKLSATRKKQSSDPTWNIRPACSKEKANKIRESNTGRRWVHKIDTKERKNVTSEEFLTLCANGWNPGKGVF
jgi:hypothetical protein